MFHTAENEIDRIKSMHKFGIDQTQSLIRYYGGNKKKAYLTLLDFNKREVAAGYFFLTEIKNTYVIVDMIKNGEIYSINKDKYDVYEADEDDDKATVYAYCHETDEEIVLIDNYMVIYPERVSMVKNRTYFSSESKGVAIERLKPIMGYDCNYKMSADKLEELCKYYGVTWFRGYPALRVDNEYDSSLRHHWIVGCMKWGFEVAVDCVGVKAFRTHDIHHVESYRLTKNNSVKNLVALDTATHERIHSNFWLK